MNVVKPAPQAMTMMRRMKSESVGAVRQEVEEKAFDDFNLYTLPRKIDLRDGETKQGEFLRSDKLQAEKIYLYAPAGLRHLGRLELRKRREWPLISSENVSSPTLKPVTRRNRPGALQNHRQKPIQGCQGHHRSGASLTLEQLENRESLNGLQKGRCPHHRILGHPAAGYDPGQSPTPPSIAPSMPNRSCPRSKKQQRLVRGQTAVEHTRNNKSDCYLKTYQ